ncbi:hypothetical protein CUT44_22085 [Streptomyces carminius]|uniref:Integral membrane protein n=1 Tax=Streptomyces carminius TaxID=2665496 RepID=A0A2M8LUP8_9ACTN|nr:hypothetical protein [Streptomyces carminius]PJE95659.1 hypothetical protein CUT44_22085 [Streptomyces carminius]
MGRGAYALARVAVYVRTAGIALWWTGVAAAGAGLAFPGLTGRRIGVLSGAALFLLAAVAAFLVRRRRCAGLIRAASRAGKWVVLHDRKVTVRAWLRSRRWWLAAAFLVAVGSSAAVPAAGGMLLSGAGAGLWAKAVWLGRWERRHEQLLWIRPEWAAGRSPARKDVRGWLTTGPLAGDAAPGGAPRRAAAAAARERRPRARVTAAAR